MTSQELLCIFMGAAAAGFINGMAAFGTALFALGFFLTVMSPVQAVAVTVSIAAVNGVQGIWVVRHEMMANLPRLARFLVPGLIGIPVGLSMLEMINAETLKLMIAGFLILYGGYFSLRRKLPDIAQRTPVIDALVGFAGGVLGGAVALSGVLPTMWCSLRNWPKAEVRAVLQPYNLSVLGFAMIILIGKGAYDRETLVFVAIAMPVAIIFARIGIAAFRRIPGALFHRLLIGLCLVSGTLLMIRELL
ncbi:sulfite exporter TauE/SafE family protein [Roseobacter sp.]|uniref:sulfite exporter TauE/SafE family protein n=1 Tax=Roseobacter sp. TaxID=1907202 RepID=UPI0025FA403D|nr:sulfite exporter TauE/SafE family protein [Roseobacter sp.]